MKTLLKILGVALFLAGSIFFLQGISVLPGSYMTGDPNWVRNGNILILMGIGLFAWGAQK